MFKKNFLTVKIIENRVIKQKERKYRQPEYDKMAQNREKNITVLQNLT